MYSNLTKKAPLNSKLIFIISDFAPDIKHQQLRRKGWIKQRKNKKIHMYSTICSRNITVWPPCSKSQTHNIRRYMLAFNKTGEYYIKINCQVQVGMIWVIMITYTNTLAVSQLQQFQTVL
jgi:hypothetical protein